jgi:hypothetical protein
MDTARDALPDDIAALKEALATERAKAFEIAAELAVARAKASHYMMLLSAAFGLFLIVRGGLAQPRAWIWVATHALAFLSFAYWLVISADQLGSLRSDLRRSQQPS